MQQNQKFLVSFINGLNHKHLFFAIWFAIVAVFTALIYNFYKKSMQRNFKENDGRRKTTALSKAPGKDLKG
jgi:hypothetical protein